MRINYETAEVIKRCYAEMSNKEIAISTGHTYSQIKNFATKHNLKKSEDFAKKQRESGYFKPGRESHNKGKKMSPEVYEKLKHTMFKKHSEPHNLKYDGYARKDRDGYTLVRVGKGKFKLKHRLIYEQHYGPILTDQLIVFRNGDKTDLRIENLEAIDKAENMRRNTIHNLPEELKETITLLKRINIKINRHGTQ